MEVKWRTIESAPRKPLDKQGYGPELLLWVDGQVGIGFWDRDFKNFYVEYPPEQHGMPAFWMPLPKPPK